MYDSYADVLESYMIEPANEADSVTFSKKDKIKAGLVFGGMAAAAIGSAYLSKKDKESRRKHEEEVAKRKAEEQKRKEKEEAFEKNQIHLEFNRKRALEESGLKINPIPDKDPKVIERLCSLIEKDLRLALPKILATKEVNNGIERFCTQYNNCPKEERNDRFYDMAEDYGPNTMTPNWVKSQFKIGSSDSEEDRIYFDTCNKNFFWRYGTNAVQDVLIMYIEKKYIHYVSSSDNSGKGWIEFYATYNPFNMKRFDY